MREIKVIRSKQNQLIKDLKQIGKKGPYKRAFVAEGLRLVEPVLASGMRVVAAVFGEGFAEKNEEVLLSLDQRLEGCLPFFVLGDDLFVEVADTVTPQGILLLVERRETADFTALGDGARMLMVLDRVQDPGNVGTLVRTAAGLGVDGILAIEGTADPYEAKTVRSAMGASLHIPIVLGLSIAEAYGWLKEHGFTIWAADMDGSDLSDCEFTAPLALVLGNEGRGLSEEARNGVDRVVRIPLSESVESLNVAIAGGIIAYQMKRMVE